MKKNKFITGIAIFVLFFASNAFSACNFQFNLGDDKDEIVNKIQSRPFPLEHVGLEVVPILADDICPEQKLTDVGIELKFLNDELVAINLIALNDENNHVSEKLTLMNYAKKAYGSFDTSLNPKAYTGYNIYELTNKFVIYQKDLGEDGRTNEQLYISTDHYDKKLMDFYKKIEIEQMENNNEN